MPLGTFTRRFGDVREVGPGKRDREQPHLHPNSATEILWYRALLAKAFFDTDKGPQEFAYIPDDLFMALDFAGFVGPENFDQEETTHDEEQDIDQGEPTENVAPVASLAAQKDDVAGRPASPTEKTFPIPASDRLLDDACTLLAALRMGLTLPETRIRLASSGNFCLPPI